jgi:glutamine amidotransferase
MRIKIVDYKAGNAPSVMHAIKRLGFEAVFARSAEDFADASHIILPGVGSAKATMESLREMGLIAVLEEAVLERKCLFWGICVGLQILFEHSEEDDADCLAWLKGQVHRFDDKKVRVPHIGWNEVRFTSGNSDGFFYFVNSYYAKPEDETVIWGRTNYDVTFASAIHKENIFATQFHIEKSGEAGLKLLNDFLRKQPCSHVD